MTAIPQPGEAPNGLDAELPAAAELGDAARKRVVDGIKQVLARLCASGLLATDKDYVRMVGDPWSLHAFIQAFKANRAQFDDLVVDAAGKAVADDTTPLACGPSLAQVCQSLVYTCAKRMFTSADPAKPAAPAEKPAGRLAALFGKRPEARVAASEDELKLAALKPLLAFDWQLPLLKFYYFFLDRHQIAALGRDLLLLRKGEDVEAVGKVAAPKIAQARRLTGPEFADMLARRPAAVSGLVNTVPQLFVMFRPILGDRIWDFVCRDPHYIDALGELDRDLLATFGPLLADSCLEAVAAFQRMPLSRVRAFLGAMHAVLPEDAATVLGDTAFCRQTLKGMVDGFQKFDGTMDEFNDLAAMKWKAITPAARAYLAKRRTAPA